MTPRAVAWLLVAVAIAAGIAGDRPQAAQPLTLGGYRVLAVDFHVHSSTFSDSGVTPWGIVVEAKRNGLDALSINGHNQVWDGKSARAFSQRIGGPTILTGQEIIAGTGPHIVAVGTDSVINGRGRDVAAVADEIHRQGGIAIAAHPFPAFWPRYDAAAIERLDGAEICHPMIYAFHSAQGELEQFATRGTFAAIGSSDYHGLGRLGLCRTYVFATANTADAILDAVRARRTVVYGRDGRTYGDPALVRLSAAHPRLREAATIDPPPGVLDWVSRGTGALGLLGLVLLDHRRDRRLTV